MAATVTNAKALVLQAAHRVTAAIFPWPPKAEREARIEEARAMLAQAQQERREAERLSAETAPLIAWLTAELARIKADRAGRAAQ